MDALNEGPCKLAYRSVGNEPQVDLSRRLLMAALSASLRRIGDMDIDSGGARVPSIRMLWGYIRIVSLIASGSGCTTGSRKGYIRTSAIIYAAA